MANLIEFLLPASKRAVRMRVLDTEEYVRLKYRAAAQMRSTAAGSGNGGSAAVEIDPEGMRKMNLEWLASIIASYTAPLPLVPKDATVDAILDAVPAVAWIATSYERLISAGPDGLYRVFSDPRDYDALERTLNDQLRGETGPLEARPRLISAD